MNLSRLLIVWFGFMAACINPKTNGEKATSQKHLVEVSELKAIIDNDSLIIVDMRRQNEYLAGHLPRAINIWRDDIESDSLNYGGMIAPKQKIEHLLGRLGVTNTDFVVIYDDNASCDAARLWWVLDYYGYQRTAILNGGLSAWKTQGEVEEEVTKRKEVKFEFITDANSKRYISHQELAEIYLSPKLKIIDTRTQPEYSGEQKKSGAFDQGRIPGSINIDWLEAMNKKKQTFKSNSDLKRLYESKGVDSNSQIIVYCHSGVRSAHTTFVLSVLLGYQNVRNYDGSWTEWSYHQLPLDRDSIKITL